MSAWKLIAYYALPPPLILTVLLIIPCPVAIKKGLLIFTRKVLFADVFGGFKLVHVMMALTGIALCASGMHTFRLSQEVVDDRLTPNQRVGLLARKWREERNFWIAALTFLLWGSVYRFYALVMEHLQLKEQVKRLERAIGDLSDIASSAAAAPQAAKPSAPPAPQEIPSRTAAGSGAAIRPSKAAAAPASVAVKKEEEAASGKAKAT